MFLDSAPEQPLAATVTAIDTEASFTPENIYFEDDRVTQVFGLKLEIDNPGGFAKPGMPADGEILLEKRRGRRMTVAPLKTTAEVETADSAIAVHNLRKCYGPLEALKGIDFTVKRGEIFGLIGPDGAGKTTTFGILAGVMESTSGEVVVLGTLPRAARLDLGYVTQKFSLYDDLSIAENMRYSAGLRQVPEDEFETRSDDLLRRVDLHRFTGRLAGQLSGGMKQKLALCCTLMAQPKVLLLDEPTTGVDPVSRREFWDLLAAVAADGVTVVAATPYLDEAERCNRIALIYEGEIQQIGTLSRTKR